MARSGCPVLVVIRIDLAQKGRIFTPIGPFFVSVAQLCEMVCSKISGYT